MLNFVQLQSNDRRLEMAAPEIKKSIMQKYAKWVTKNDVADPRQDDPKHRRSEIDDGVLKINLHEGNRERQDGKYLELIYRPSAKGPYNAWATANADFAKYKAVVVERQRQAVVNGMKKAEKKNPDPF